MIRIKSFQNIQMTELFSISPAFVKISLSLSDGVVQRRTEGFNTKLNVAHFIDKKSYSYTIVRLTYIYADYLWNF